MKLTNIECKNLKPAEKPYKVADGGGMFLQVMPNGKKYWRLKYRFLGKEKLLSLGVYPRITLAEARERREEAKKLLDQNRDPSETKKLEKLEVAHGYANNFELLAREWHAQQIHTWKPKHAANILNRMEMYLFPDFGSRPLREINAPEILASLRKVEAKGNHDLTRRLLQHCSKVFCYAIATGRADRDVTTGLIDALKPVQTKHHVYLEEKELPAFLKKLEKYDTETYNGRTLTKLAFQFLILTFVRSGEIRGAKWDEIDFDKAQWKIPAERMKMKTPHIVPLAKQSIEILRKIWEISGHNLNKYVFPNQTTPRNIMSENTFLKAIEVLGYKGKTVGHGFRSTASTILNENGFKSDIIERQLAHCERNQVRGAYNYAEYLSQRAEMMQWWADYLDAAEKKKGN